MLSALAEPIMVIVAMVNVFSKYFFEYTMILMWVVFLSDARRVDRMRMAFCRSAREGTREMAINMLRALAVACGCLIVVSLLATRFMR